MPIEYILLKGEPTRIKVCPACGEPFVPFMRGMVHNGWRRFRRRPYVAMICEACEQVVGYESPHVVEVTFRSARVAVPTAPVPAPAKTR